MMIGTVMMMVMRLCHVVDSHLNNELREASIILVDSCDNSRVFISCSICNGANEDTHIFFRSNDDNSMDIHPEETMSVFVRL